jgi:hypothetical protein
MPLRMIVLFLAPTLFCVPVIAQEKKSIQGSYAVSEGIARWADAMANEIIDLQHMP